LKNYQGPFASKVVLGANWFHIARKNRVDMYWCGGTS
jgi:hypothetical protein